MKLVIHKEKGVAFTKSLRNRKDKKKIRKIIGL
jgi:hypothetical protein